MIRNPTLRAALGNLQAWDSNVHEAGLSIVRWVSLAMALPPVALLVAIPQQYMIAAFALSLVLLVAGRLLAPIPLPGLFLILIPAAMGSIFTGLIKQER